jgi:ABC-type transport system involved in multi-copper enzyme maturation permease subunit
LGTAQMYGDRANRISSLLATLAVTRDRILLARVLVGVLTVLGTLVPVLLTEIILLRISVMPLAFYRRVAVEISITTILMGVACYCVGLAVGGTANKAWLIPGNLLSLVLCVSLVVFEGCGPKAMAILLIFIAAILSRTWLKFTAASL